MSRYTHLALEQRYQIAALLEEKISQTRIAEVVGVHKSTISREVKRNTVGSRYFPRQAHRLALHQRHGKSERRIARSTWALVEEKLRQDWSPEQISGWLGEHHDLGVSHESIYQYVGRDKANGGDLWCHLRQAAKRRKPYGTPRRKGLILGRVSIDERPEIVAQRGRVGDWEADTIVGKPGRAVIVSLVERRSRLTVLARAPSRKAEAVERAIHKALLPLAAKVHTVTCDNGSEFARHASLAHYLKAQFFFAHPYAAWERGLNENTNGLVRQYFPKGMDLSDVTDEQLQHVGQKLNNRPRKTLGYATPNEIFYSKPTVALRC